MTEAQILERNIKAATVLGCKMTIESLGAIVTISSGHMKEQAKTAAKRLGKMVDIISADLQITDTSQDAKQMLDDTERIVYLIAELNEVQRKRVVGLITKIKK